MIGTLYITNTPTCLQIAHTRTWKNPYVPILFNLNEILFNALFGRKGSRYIHKEHNIHYHDQDDKIADDNGIKRHSLDYAKEADGTDNGMELYCWQTLLIKLRRYQCGESEAVINSNTRIVKNP